MTRLTRRAWGWLLLALWSLASTQAQTPETFSTTEALFVADEYAYVGIWHPDTALVVLDVSDPTQVVEVSRTPTPLLRDIEVIGNQIYGVSEGGFLILDAQNREAPKIIYEARDVSSDSQLDYEDGRVYLAHSSLQILDVKNVDQVDQKEYRGSGFFEDVKAEGDTVYVGAGDGSPIPFEMWGLYVVDLRDPAQPEVIGYHRTEYSDGVHVEMARQHVFYAADPLIEIFDVSKSEPERVGTLDFGSRLVLDVQERDSLLGVSSVGERDFELLLYRVTHPADPTLLSMLPVESGVFHLVAGRLYVGGEGVTIYDITDPSDPVLLGAYATAAEDAPDHPPRASLAESYPNPFRTHTTVTYTLPAPDPVRLAVYDVLGREVAVLVDEEQPAGTHHVRFAAAGRPSGWYLVRVQAGRHQATRPVLLAR